jgi:uncharacterized protein YfaS (alpha-2-macroglobulin family)
VRSTAVPVTAQAVRLLAANETWQHKIALPGAEGANTLALEFSRIPPLNLEKRLEYLIQYPHGCIEQTTSSVFPQLFLDKALALSSEDVSRIRRNVAAGIERIAAFQTYNGGFSYWPADGEPNDWGTSYAGHFLIMARKLGFTVPAALLSKWTAYQRNRAVLWSNSGSEREQAYRLYTLALAGEADIGSMNKLREYRNLPGDAAWRLAAAYWYAGQRETARSLTRTLPAFSAYRELSGTFGSDFRDKAMILETLSIMGDESRAKDVLQDISAVFASDQWLSTQETAYGLLAVLPYTRTGKEPVTVEYAIGGGKAQTLTFSAPVAQVPLGNTAGKESAVTITSKAAFPVYAQIRARGLPPEGAEPALANGLKLYLFYYLGNTSVEPSAVKQGDDMEVRIVVTNAHTADLKEIALIYPVGAEWEIVNTRLISATKTDIFTYQDIRDDRALTYFDLDKGGSKTFVLQLNKTYRGSFFTPAVHAYAMYNESIQAVVPGILPKR